MPHTRRSIVGAGVTIVSSMSFAGCLSFSGTGRGVTDIYVSNNTGYSVSVNLQIANSNGDPILNRNFTLGSQETKKINNKVAMGGSKTIVIKVNNGTSKEYTWQDAEEPLQININRRAITFGEYTG